MNRERCFECDATEDTHQHHVVPESIGGKRTIPLCAVCHGKVHDRSFVGHTRLIKLAAAKARKNEDPWGRKPFGHTPEEKITLTRMEDLRYRRRHTPRSFRAIAATLDAEGLPSRSGKLWTAQSIKRILNRATV